MNSTPYNINLIDASDAPDVWYAPSNGGEAGRGLPDFKAIFELTEGGQWPVGLSGTSTIVLRANTLRWAMESDPDFIAETLAPFLKATGLKLVINTAGANFAGTKTEKQITNAFKKDLDLIELFQDAGIKIDAMMLQSTLSKPLEGGGTYSLSQRVADAVSYIDKMAALHPEMRFGISDALVAKGDAWVGANIGVRNAYEAYEALINGLRASGRELGFVNLDHPWEAFSDFNPAGRSSVMRINSITAWLEERGVATNLMVTTSSAISDADYYAKSMQVLNSALSTGGTNDFTVTSWDTFPTVELSENASYSLTRELMDVSEASHAVASVAEDEEIGTIVGRFAAFDRNGNISSLALLTPDTPFAIQGSHLVLVSGLNYEAQSSYEIMVRATDAHGAYRDESFTIVVEDHTGETLVGSRNDDRLTGGRKDDILEGQTGRDTLEGGDGKDVLIGGRQQDILFGGAGNDIFRFGRGDSTVAEPDLIRDFHHGDKIDLALLNLAFAGESHTVLRDSITWHLNGEGGTIVQADYTGDNTVDLTIVIAGSHRLSIDDFLL